MLMVGVCGEMPCFGIQRIVVTENKPTGYHVMVTVFVLYDFCSVIVKELHEMKL